ncbi:MAG: MATE family efflux transporter [Candidatus Coproplasma sp.]
MKSQGIKTKKTVDLTKGNVWKVLLLYSLPLLGSAIVQQAYSLVDLLVVGNFASNGQTALTAVGEASTMVNILLAFAFGCEGGCSVIVAKYFGAKNNFKVKETVNTSIITFSVMCVAVMALGFGLAVPSMYLLDVTDPAVMADSLTYLYIYTGSMPFVFLYNVGCGICSALGDSKTPFLFLVFSSVVNIGLDFLFVCVLKWEVAGAAWATFISQALSCILTVIVLIGKLKCVTCEGKPKVFNRAICKDLLLTSVPIILQQSFVSVGNFFVQKRINMISLDAAAGFTTGFKLVQIANVGVGHMNGGWANYCSQNKSAGEYRRIKQGYFAILTYCMSVSLIFLILCETIPYQLTMLFINPDSITQEAIDSSMLFMRIVAAFLPAVCVKIVSDGAVRGCGGNLGFTISTFTDLLLRVAFVYILVGVGMGFSGVCWAWAIGWTVSMFVAVTFYIFIPCLRRKNKAAEGVIN